MNMNKINLKKTAVLYFDMLNGYFHSMDTAKAHKKSRFPLHGAGTRDTRRI